MNDALDCLTTGGNCGEFKPEETYPGLRGAVTWSTDWDAANGDNWVDSVAPHIHELP